MRYGKLEETVNHNLNRDSEERAKASTKFAELFTRMANNEGTVQALNVKVDNLGEVCRKIDGKLDRLLEKN